MKAGIVTIMLVEDDIIDVAAVKRAFKDLQIDNPLVVATDGIKALDLLRGTNGSEKLLPPYLIMLDLNMPRMDGFEFLDVLRHDPEIDKSIVFVLTTSSAQEDRVKAYEKHISGYMLKMQAGKPFAEAISLIEHYGKTIEFPVP
jgi:CheY-like chemotaxis protein